MSGLSPLTGASINDESGPKTGIFTACRQFFLCRFSGSRTEDPAYAEFGEFHGNDRQKKVGTFAGVFCPVVLSMFSALVFIRMGFLIGNAGLIVTLAQFSISYIILIFTVFSVCAVSTNGAIEGGGVYFMISRSLGPEFGGAIGTLFFFANVVSSALCFSACTEGLVEVFGASGYLINTESWYLSDGPWWRTLYGSILALVALMISLGGAKYFARASLAIWTAVTVALTSVLLSFLIEGEKEVKVPESNKLVNFTSLNYTGLSSQTFMDNLWPRYWEDYRNDGAAIDFATVFGFLFSGVTGVMAGANMSGELKNPSKSIPRGTIGALIFTSITYLALSLLTAATCSYQLLQNNYLYMLPINIWPPFIAVGVITATFSAGLSSMIGASRVLEALVKDNLFGGVMRWCSRPSLCVLIAWAFVQLGLMGKSLSAIAQANTALFLLSYMAVNLACLALEVAGAPNFRPSFKCFTWHTALLGMVGALTMMFIAASFLAGLAIILCLLLIILLHLLSPAAAAAPWGSISQALIFHQVRKYLLLLDTRKEHVKYWRPQVLLLVGNARTVPPLAKFANHLKKGGLLVLGHVYQSSLSRVPPSHTPWLYLVDHLKIKAFVELCISSSVREGAKQLAHLSGLGAMKPNMIMLGFYDDAPNLDFYTDVDSPLQSAILEASLPLHERRLTGPAEYVALLSDVLDMDKHLCICRHFHNINMQQVEKASDVKYIDIWLTDFISPSSSDPFSVAGLFTLQLACILGTQTNWKKLKLRVMLTDTPDAPSSTTTASFYLHRTFTDEAHASHTNLSDNINNFDVETEAAVAHLASSIRPAYARLTDLLKLLRIPASIHKIDEWNENVERLRFIENLEDSQINSATVDIPHKYNLPENYIRSVNDMIKRNSSTKTAVIFICLPPPPSDSDEKYGLTNDSFLTVPENSKNMSQFSADYVEESANKDYLDKERKAYLNIIKNITENLPPVVMVHGLKSVTSTAL